MKRSGDFLAASMSSAMVLTGTDGWTMTTLVIFAIPAIGIRSVAGLKLRSGNRCGLATMGRPLIMMV